MEQNTPYRYEAKNCGSYNELAAYAINLVANVSLFPEHQTIVIDGKMAKDVGEFIDKQGLDFFIAPIEVDDDNIDSVVNSATTDSDSLRKIIKRIKERKADQEKYFKNIIGNISDERDKIKKDSDLYSKFWSEADARNDRVKEQVKAIAVLINSIFPK